MTDPVIDNRIVVADDVIVNDRAVIINHRRSRCRNDMFGQAMISEMARWNKGVMIRRKPEPKAESDVMIIIAESDSGTNITARW